MELAAEGCGQDDVFGGGENLGQALLAAIPGSEAAELPAMASTRGCCSIMGGSVIGCRRTWGRLRDTFVLPWCDSLLIGPASLGGVHVLPPPKLDSTPRRVKSGK